MPRSASIQKYGVGGLILTWT